MADRLMATARDKALQEISKLSPEARAYLTALAKKSNAMNQRSMGSGDEYVKGQIRASKGQPKRVQKAAPKKASAAAKKTVGRSGSPSAGARKTGGVAKKAASTASRSGNMSAQQRQLNKMVEGRAKRPMPKSNVSRGKGSFKEEFIDPFGRAGKKLGKLLNG